MSHELSPKVSFDDFGLIPPVLKAVNKVGFEVPSPIQAKTIPHILAGRDVVGQAQTGTGKTAAFTLPLLSRIDLSKTYPQVLVLTPTRELAIQVAEAFEEHASFLKGFYVLSVYGGQGYDHQLKKLRKGVHVVVGTPGRVMDHVRRKTLQLDKVDCLVLDEADEMLKMGFQEDVEWILDHTPNEHQVTLFSATIPHEIRRLSKKYLKEPEEVTIEVKTATVETIDQKLILVKGSQKREAIMRLLEGEEFDGVLVFVRTKAATLELAEKISGFGYKCSPLNGDMSQNQRERNMDQLKSGKIDILVATDVAARGLDVDRISHVINYDIPFDVEAYIHRIGRTGRAGREGKAFLFVDPREMRNLRTIEKATRQRIEKVDLPSPKQINQKRIERFKENISKTLNDDKIEVFAKLLKSYQEETTEDPIRIAAALAQIAQGNKPFLLDETPKMKERVRRQEREQQARFTLNIGYLDGVKPRQVLKALCEGIGVDREFIGRIDISSNTTTFDVPEAIPEQFMRQVRVRIGEKTLKVFTSKKRKYKQDFADARGRKDGGRSRNGSRSGSSRGGSSRSNDSRKAGAENWKKGGKKKKSRNRKK